MLSHLNAQTTHRQTTVILPLLYLSPPSLYLDYLPLFSLLESWKTPQTSVALSVQHAFSARRGLLASFRDIGAGMMFNSSCPLDIFSFTHPEVVSEVLNGSSQLFFNVSMAMWNKSCGEQLLDFTTAEKIVIGLMLAIITTVTVIGNTLVVIAVCVVKKLRQPSNYLLVSLAVADLSVAIVVMPFVIVTDLTGGKWLFGEVFCNIFIGMDVMCCTASIMTLCVISVDR